MRHFKTPLIRPFLRLVTGDEILLRHHIFFTILLSLSTILLSSCDSVDRTVTAYLDGCRDKQGFLLGESLKRINDDHVILGNIEFSAPRGYYSRVDRDQVSIFQGVYCDSGDWGINVGNQIRVKLYDGSAPMDLYADFPKEQEYILKRMAAPIGSLDYEVTIAGRLWRAQLELWGNLVPSVRTAYLTTNLGTQTLTVTFVAEIGAQADTSSLVTIVRSIRERNSR